MLRFDEAVQTFVKDLDQILWQDFKRVGINEDYYDYYYAENEHYIIRDRITEQLYFTKARSPKEALANLQAAQWGE